MNNFDVIVVGAGAAGLMAAGAAAEGGSKTLILERNERPARKLMITGKGRCNVTNVSTMLNDLIEAVPVNGRFLYSAFSRFMPSDTIDFFENQGVPLKIERGNRVFPKSDKAVDVVDALNRHAQKSGAKRVQARVLDLIFDEGRLSGVRSEDGREFFAKSVIIATGGASYPLTGSTGDGYALARQAGHKIREPEPSLVPLEIKENYCRELQGLSLRNVAIRVLDLHTYSEKYKDFGEMLFTHFGVSGPIILSASSHMRDIKEGKYLIELDLKPALSFEQLDARIQRDIAKNPNKAAINALQGLLPKAMIPVVLGLCEIPFDKKANQINREIRHSLVECLKEFRLSIKGFRPIEEAIITSGGVLINEVSPKNMESKLCSGLFFAGEVLDVDAYTGGYNLQIAFSTGVLAGKSAANL